MDPTTPIKPRLKLKARRQHASTDSAPGKCIGQRLAGFLHQLRERKVCRAAAAYAILSWVILQLGEIVFPTLSLPPWTLTLVVVVAVAGFPIAMILAWVLQWTDRGLVIDVAQESGNSKHSRLDSMLSIALLLAAIVISAELLWDNSIPRAVAAPTAVADEQRRNIAVMQFSAQDDASRQDAHTLERFLRHHLVQTDLQPFTVVAGLTRDEVYASGGTSVLLAWVIEGSVHSKDGEVRLLLQLIELPDRRYVDSWLLASVPEAPVSHFDLAKSAIDAMIDHLSVDDG